MISVIISTYNRPESLKKAIESVFAQSYTDWELIVVHDEEGENTSEGKISHYYIKHFGSDTAPKNLGILQAKGDYVAFLDDDNTWRPDHLQVLLKAIERDPRIDVVYGDRWLTDLAGKIPSRLGMMSDFSIGLLLQRNFIDTSDVLVKRQALFDVGGFDERYTKYVDWNLWIRMAKAGKQFLHVPIILTDYYLSKDAKSSVGDKYTQNEKAMISRWGGSTNHPDWRLFSEKDIEMRLTSDFGQYDLEIELPYLGEVKEPRVAIYSLTYDRLELTKKCFESLYKTAGYPYHHFIIDNGSTDGTKEWLEEYKQHHGFVFVTQNEENKGISIASNQAIDQITGLGDYDIIVKVDNDALFITPNWLKTMVRIWKSNHRLVMSPYVQGLRDNPGGAPRIGWGWIGGEYLGMTKHIGGIVHFVDADAYKTWRWSEEDFLHGMQDLEFSQDLLLNGYQMGYLENYFVEHCEGTEGQLKKFPEYFERRKIEKTKRMKRTSEPYNVNNRTYWNGIYSDEDKRAEYSAAGTSSVTIHNGKYTAVDKTQRFIRAVEEIKDGEKVLDIGCGIGNFTKLLKKTHPKCEIWGTDISDVVIKANKKENPDIEYISLQIGNQGFLPFAYFDVVFCGETIEHLDQPKILFQDAYRVLKTGGRLIITTPNEDHIKSNEHVWFFEKEDVTKLYEDNGFKDVQMVELDDIEHLFVIFGIGVKV